MNTEDNELIRANIMKTMAETMKLGAETRKITEENRYYFRITMGTLLVGFMAALATLIVAFVKLMP